MTGILASLAFLRAGRIALLSWASRTRTLAPFEISVSTSVSCCSVLRFASASMYLPPASVTVCWMFGLSWAAQRGCWKLFHDTATEHDPAAALPLGAAAEPEGAAALPLGAAAVALAAAAVALAWAAVAVAAAAVDVAAAWLACAV